MSSLIKELEVSWELEEGDLMRGTELAKEVNKVFNPCELLSNLVRLVISEEIVIMVFALIKDSISIKQVMLNSTYQFDSSLMQDFKTLPHTWSLELSFSSYPLEVSYFHKMCQALFHISPTSSFHCTSEQVCQDPDERQHSCCSKVCRSSTRSVY